MKIYLVRHADADAELPEGLGDDARALTSKARGAILRHFLDLAPRVGKVGAIFTSPLVRTVQTSQLFSLAIRHEGPLKAHRSLLPDMPVGSVDALISHHVGEDLVLVGHQPSMGALAAHLLGMQHSFPRPVNPGTVIALDRPDEIAPRGGHDTPAPIVATLRFYAAPGQTLVESL